MHEAGDFGQPPALTRSTTTANLAQLSDSIIAFGLLYGLTFLVTAPLTVVFAGNIFGSGRLGTVIGIISMVHPIARGLSAFVGALIFDRFESYDGAFALMLGLAFLATAATALVRERPTTRVAAHA